jgi:hypothetical protein
VRPGTNWQPSVLGVHNGRLRRGVELLHCASKPCKIGTVGKRARIVRRSTLGKAHGAVYGALRAGFPFGFSRRPFLSLLWPPAGAFVMQYVTALRAKSDRHGLRECDRSTLSGP